MKAFISISIIGFFLLLSDVSCKKTDSSPVMPPETQEGRSTFGCLINNSLFVNYGTSNLYGPNLEVYDVAQHFISIESYMKYDNHHYKFIGFVIKKPIKEGLYFFNSTESQAFFQIEIDDNSGCYYKTDTNKITGTLEISKSDTVKRILSGRFNFKAHKYYHTNAHGDTLKGTCDSIITVTQGRFDIHYYFNF